MTPSTKMGSAKPSKHHVWSTARVHEDFENDESERGGPKNVIPKCSKTNSLVKKNISNRINSDIPKVKNIFLDFDRGSLNIDLFYLQKVSFFF
mgnify:CR=1 FL=1